MATEPRFASQRRVVLAGSEKKAFTAETIPAKAGAVASPAETEKITVSVIVASKTPYVMTKEGTPERLSREEFANRHGANPESLQKVQEFAQEFGLTVEPGQQIGPCTVRLSGTVADIEKAFGVSLETQTLKAGTFRVREGAIYLPEELDGHVLAVLGLDNRPQAQPHFDVAQPHVANVSYTPVQVAALYGFPAGATASGQTIGLIELGGGYRESDVTAYFQTLGLTPPTITAVSVDGGKNTPGDANGADGEVMLDIEVCASVATGASVAVYFAPNTDQGFIDAITTAVHDSTNKPSVISISWGGPESSWTSQATSALDAACQAAAALGVTITVACGDNGSTDGGTGDNVDFPASSPHVLACGGSG